MGVIADNDILIKDIIGDEQNEGEFTLVLPKANGSENNPRFAIVGKLNLQKRSHCAKFILQTILL